MIFGRLWEEAENGNGEHRTNGSARRQTRDTRTTPGPVRISDTEPVID